MNWRTQIPAIAWLGIGIAIATGAHNLGVGALNSPGPGLFAFIIGVSMALLSISIVVTGIGAPAEPEISSTAAPRRALPVVAVVAALMFYALALERIGFVLCTLLFLAGLLGVLGRRSWLVTATASLGITAGSYVIFAKLLKINLPIGPLGF